MVFSCCALCGKQIKGAKRQIEASFDGKGLPHADKLAMHID